MLVSSLTFTRLADTGRTVKMAASPARPCVARPGYQLESLHVARPYDAELPTIRRAIVIKGLRPGGDRRGDKPRGEAGARLISCGLREQAPNGQGADSLPTNLVRRSDLYLRLQRAGEGSNDSATALGMLQRAAQPGAFSALLGRAYVTLGRALQAQGRAGKRAPQSRQPRAPARRARARPSRYARARQLQALDP